MNLNNNVVRNRPPVGLRMRIVALVWKASEAMFAEIDMFAWVQRWEIGRTWHTHTYRDRRFGALIVCPACAATGRTRAGRPCGECRGTGRINLLEPPIPPTSGGSRGTERPFGGRS